MEAFHHGRWGGGHKGPALLLHRSPGKKKKKGGESHFFLKDSRPRSPIVHLWRQKWGMWTFNDPELGGSCLVRSPRGRSSRLTHAAAMLTERVTAKVGESVKGWGASDWLDEHQTKGGRSLIGASDWVKSGKKIPSLSLDPGEAFSVFSSAPTN